MDDHTRVAKASGWEPRHDAGGKVEIGLSHNDSGRMQLEAVTLQRYIELWDTKAIKFQVEGKPKPEYLPTREEAREALDQEIERLANRAYEHSSPVFEETPVYRGPMLLTEVFKQPKPSKVLPQEKKPEVSSAERAELVRRAFKNEKKVSKPKSSQAKAEPAVDEDHTPPVWSVKACAIVFGKRSEREQEILRAVSVDKKVSELSDESAKAIFSGLATLIGLPYQRKGFSRKEAVQEVIKEYDRARRAEPSSDPVGKRKKPRTNKDFEAQKAVPKSNEAKQFIYDEYRKAAKDIRNRGEKVTFETLGRQLRLRRVLIESFLYQNPSLKNEILGSAAT